MIMDLISLVVLTLIISSFNGITKGLPMSKNVLSDLRKPYENPDFFEGDMIYPQLTGRTLATSGPNKPWTNGIVPYVISSAFDLTKQLFIIVTMRKMEQYLSINNFKCIQFRPRNVSSDTSYVSIINGTSCYSTVGQNTAVSAANTVSLRDFECLYEGIIMHELLHILGFFHEQSRPDRDTYVRINYENIPGNLAFNFDKYSISNVNTLNLSYDYESIMHYDMYAFSENGLPTIEPLQANVTIGQRDNMSASDIEAVRRFYNCSATGQTLPPNPILTTVNYYRYNITISGVLSSTTNPVFISPLTVYSVPYDEYMINVYTDGYCMIDSTSDTVEFLLYINSFNSSNPSLNLIASNGDYGSYALFLHEYYFQSAVTYILIVSASSSYSIESYSMTLSGFDRINMTQINNNPLTTTTLSTIISDTSTSTVTTTSGTHSAGILIFSTKHNILVLVVSYSIYLRLKIQFE